MPFIFSQLPEEQQLPHLTWKNLFLPKNNFSFKCPLQRGWNNLSSTLWRQKKEIAWVSLYLQQGKRQRSHYRSGWSSNGIFPACHFCKKEAQFRSGNLWAPRTQIINISHAGSVAIRYNLEILTQQVLSGFPPPLLPINAESSGTFYSFKLLIFFASQLTLLWVRYIA